MQVERTTEQKAEEVLRDLDSPEPITPAPWFYTRLEARIKERRQGYGSRGVVLAAACVAVVALVNIGMIVIRYGTGEDVQYTNEQVVSIFTGNDSRETVSGIPGILSRE